MMVSKVHVNVTDRSFVQWVTYIFDNGPYLRNVRLSVCVQGQTKEMAPTCKGR